MKLLLASVFAIFVFTSSLTAQVSEVECTIYRRYAAYMTLTPAHYDLASLPQVGQQVMLSIYIKDNLPEDKQEGYYEFCIIEVIKHIPETKSITFKTTENLEDAKKRIGFPDLRFNTDSKVKISWGN